MLIGGDDRLVVVHLADIDWIGGARNYVLLHVGAAVLRCRRTLAGITADLDNRFLRIHRSTIINLDRVEELHRNASGNYDLTLRGGRLVRVSPRYRATLLSRLGRKTGRRQ